MEPLKEEGMKVEITELPWPQELRETLDYLINLVYDSRGTSSKAYEVSQLITIPDNDSPSEDLLRSLTSSLTEAITALSKSVSSLKSILKLHEKHNADESISIIPKKEETNEINNSDSDVVDDKNDISKNKNSFLERIKGEITEEENKADTSSDHLNPGNGVEEGYENGDDNGEYNEEDPDEHDHDNHYQEEEEENEKLFPKKLIREEVESNNGSKEYECERCDYSTNRKDYYKDHAKGGLKFKKCPWCQHHSKGKLGIRSHIARAHPEAKDGDSFKCLICCLKVSRIEYIYTHLQKVHSINILLHCQFCDYSTSSLKEMQQDHLRMHSEDSQLNACDHCDFTTPSKLKFNRHVNYVHKPLDCDECEESFVGNSALSKHKRTIHEEKPLKEDKRKAYIITDGVSVCTACGHQDSNHRRLMQHIRCLHRSIECNICQEKFTGVYMLIRHKKYDHNVIRKHEKEVVCDLCGKFLKVRSMENHMETHHSGVKLTCDKCEFTAASRVVMRRHERQYHEAEVPYSCELCNSGFTERKDFNNHMESTHGGHKFRCDQCSYSSSQLVNLQGHKRSKHAEGAFHCDQCNAQFGHKVSLKRHIIKHHSEGEIKKEKCPEPDCKYTYSLPAQLDIHTNKVHKGIQYPCDQCDYVANYKGTLHRHVKTIHAGVKIKCEECEFTAFYPNEIKIHAMKVHEGVTWPCSDCDFIGDTKRKLWKHVSFVHKGKAYECDMCEFKSSSSGNVKRHKRQVHKII